MSNKEYKIKLSIFIIILLILVFELIRDSQRPGDFVGYVNAGNLVLSGANIYSDKLNTWPPFFSIFSIIPALIDRISSFLVRFIWLLGSIISMFIVMKLTTEIGLNKKIVLLPLKKMPEKKEDNNLSILDSIIFIPFLIMFRFLLANLANVQINIYMLLCAIITIYFFSKRNELLAGLFLALSISLKVYTIFLLIYFIYKREFKLVFWSFLFIVFFNTLPFLVFGYKQSLFYYIHWFKNMVKPFATIVHANQSFFSFTKRLLVRESPGLSIYINIFNLNVETARYFSYSIVIVFGLYIAYLFKKRLTQRNGLKSLFEYSIIFNCIPLLSPLAWKAYFIFIWVPYFLLYLFIFKFSKGLNKSIITSLKLLFYGSIVLNVLSVEGLIGRYLSDLMEVFSCVTIGSIMVLIAQLIIYINYKKFKNIPEIL